MAGAKTMGEAAAQLLSLVNTNTSASDWVVCVTCRQNYRPAGMGPGVICRTCVDREQKRSDRLRQILDERAYEEHTLERFQVRDENREAFEAARVFDPTKNSLYLWGECGVGKSHLGSLVIRDAVVRDLRSIIQVEPSDMLREINAALNDSAEAEGRAVGKYVNASLLVLDDLGVEKVTDYKLEKLYEVINGRDKARKAGLVITSNYSLQKLSERLRDDRIISRISGMCQVKRVGGQDWRLAR